tara:strand:+ start:763 stop:1809 length:1047 start_codon:yes stop_codon:yes gene_type:complete
MLSNISIKEAEQLIATVGTKVTVHLQGQPGIGKSTILQSLAKRFPTHTPVYIDCADLDLGDLAMPAMNHEKKTTSWYPNERFAITEDKPTIVMLDEITKACEPVKNMLLPVMLERRLGAVNFHPDSIVYSTGNEVLDGVGDSMKGHAKSRVTTVTMRSPDADEYIEYGVANDHAPELLAWVKQFPHCLSSYQDKAQSENMYIYRPTEQQTAYFCPRSGTKASEIIKHRLTLGVDLTMSALIGTIGEASARDMSAYFNLSDELPTRDIIQSSPTTAPIPKDPSAQIILVMRELMAIEAKHVKSWVTYMQRLPMEVQALFGTTISESSKASEVMNEPDFTSWAVENQKYF